MNRSFIRLLILLATASGAVMVPMSAASAAAAQFPPVGNIDFYGRKTVSEAALRKALVLKEGDTLRDSDSKESIVARLRTVPGVHDAALSAVCCDDGKMMLYVGIQESAVPPVSWNAPPNGAARLPAAMMQADSIVMAAMNEGVRNGIAGEDDSLGYTLFSYPPARAAQQKYIAYAPSHVAEIRNVLHTSSDAGQRALAAELLPFAGPSAQTIDDLSFAMRDPDPSVRNNAVRALAIIALYARAHPEAHLSVPARGFTQMLNSLVWTDRNKAAFALMSLTASPDPTLLHDLAANALDALIDMARWKSRGHATGAALILGRIAGWTDAKTLQAMTADREKLISAAIASH